MTVKLSVLLKGLGEVLCPVFRTTACHYSKYFIDIYTCKKSVKYEINFLAETPIKVNIIIDVLRAFTVAHLAMMQGVKRIYLVSSIEEAFAFKAKYPEYLLAGEKDGLAIEGFDLDNSPAALLSHELYGKTLVQKTSNGTKATLENLDADRIFVTGFSNSHQLVNYLHTLPLKTLQVIPSRLKDDDFAVRDYIQALYDQKKTSQLEIIQRIVHSDVAEKFFTDSRFNPKDVIFATSEIRCDFVMEVANIGMNDVYIEKCLIDDV